MWKEKEKKVQIGKQNVIYLASQFQFRPAGPDSGQNHLESFNLIFFLPFSHHICFLPSIIAESIIASKVEKFWALKVPRVGCGCIANQNNLDKMQNPVDTWLT